VNDGTTTEDTTVFSSYEGYTQAQSTSYKEGEADSLNVTPRSFDEQKVSELRDDPTLQYKEAPTVAESLWDRVMAWIGEFFNSLFTNAVGTNWGRLFAYLLGIAIVVVIIMLILRVNAFKVFYTGEGASTFRSTVIEENIHEIDFEKEIQKAIQENDYRKGVRLIFLFALKILSDKNLIAWEQGKTNHDYVNELSARDLKKGLHELSFYFDYAWYGNFKVSRDLFGRVQHIFNDWKEKVK
jgi:hypothetical protein